MVAAGGSAHWSSRFTFVMASVGFAVGLGNIWRFPYVTGENGGSAFVLIYLFCAFCIGVPCLVSELLIGRRGQHSPPESMARVAEESGHSRHWRFVGGMGVFTAFAISVTYAVVVGWVLSYLARAVMTGFAAHGNYRAHGNNATEVADGLKLSPTGALILADRHADWVEPGKHDDAFLARRVSNPEQGRHFP